MVSIEIFLSFRILKLCDIRVSCAGTIAITRASARVQTTGLEGIVLWRVDVDVDVEK